MAQNFIACDRGQVLLMPPSLVDWLPEDHLVWTVLGAVDQMDLTGFYGSYRSNGQGRAAYNPAMMVALLMYAYARGMCSSRGIERACGEDVAFKVITALKVPDHSTIAEFRRRHETALRDVFSQVLGLCREAGLVSVGVIAVDGTKIAANASHACNVDCGQVAAGLLAEAERVDREEDERFGDQRGDELPEQLQTAEGRKAALGDAKRRLEQKLQKTPAEDGDRDGSDGDSDHDGADGGGLEIELRFDREVIERTSGKGRRRWFVEARHQLDEHRREQARPVPRSRAERLLEVEHRFEQQRLSEHAANELYEQYIAAGVTPDGRRFSAKPAPYIAPEEPEGKLNTTDPDSRVMQTKQRWVQGYNAQIAVNENQIILAAEITVDSPDFGHLDPVVRAAERELERAGVSDRPGVIVADAGYWHQQQMDEITSRGIPVLIPPDANTREGERPGWTGGRYTFMRRVLATPEGRRLYTQRQALVEPVFGNIKHNRRIDRFKRRGRAAVLSEWRLIAATHNLMKLHNHWIATDTV
jgi:transposase